MKTVAGYDPRGVANRLLELATDDRIPVTNLALQKLLYFAHGHFLTTKRRPLVSGYFEAWQYGPVHPLVYRAFSSAGAHAITDRARSIDLITGQQRIVPSTDSPEVVTQLKWVVLSYARLTPGRLVEISHASKAPWAFIKQKGEKGIALGFRIPDDVILERFKFHKVFVDETPRYGEPVEDTPLA